MSPNTNQLSIRRRYLISYDVSSDWRRDRIFETLRSNGDHAQYSVFFCELTHHELANLRGELRQYLNHHEDQILILDLGQAANPLEVGLDCLGRPYDPPVRSHIV